jgi:integrase
LQRKPINLKQGSTFVQHQQFPEKRAPFTINANYSLRLIFYFSLSAKTGRQKSEERYRKRANHTIRTIQELLGHADVRTTMIYTHTVKSSTIKKAQNHWIFPLSAKDNLVKKVYK